MENKVVEEQQTQKSTKLWKDKEAQLEHLAKAREIAKKKRAEIKNSEETQAKELAAQAKKEAKKQDRIVRKAEKKIQEKPDTSSESEQEVEEVIEVVKRPKSKKKKIIKKKIVEISSDSSSSSDDEDYKQQVKEKYKNKYKNKYGKPQKEEKVVPEDPGNLVSQTAKEQVQHYLKNQSDLMAWQSIFPNYNRI